VKTRLPQRMPCEYGPTALGADEVETGVLLMKRF
jgi:hypothetical protein